MEIEKLVCSDLSFERSLTQLCEEKNGKEQWLDMGRLSQTALRKDDVLTNTQRGC